MSSRTPRNSSELQKASIHLLYEWEMFQEYVHRLTVNDYQHTDTKLYNALLTAFGVHARNLLDFFYPPQSVKPDDMIASDYFDNPVSWETKRPEPTELFKKTREMVNKLNTHLTYKRVEWKEEDRWWLWTQIYNELVNVWNTFVTNVSPEKLNHKG